MITKNPSTAEALYQSISSIEAIEQFVADKTEEWDYIDFKTQPRPGDLEEIWGKVLSGFANSGGGVIVWGINTTKSKETKIDQADSLMPFTDPNAFRATLLDTANKMTDPPVTGVECQAFLQDDGKGFVVSLIPTGKNHPYRSLKSKGWPFYMRAGDDFHPINVSVLRMMFFPQRSVQWSCTIQPTLFEKNGTRMNVSITIKLTNHGPSTAENVMLSISGNKHCGFTGYSEPFCTALTLAPNMQSWKVTFDMNPSVTVPFNFQFHGRNETDFWTYTPDGDTLLTFTVTVNRRDALPTSGVVQFEHYQLERKDLIREVVLSEIE